MVRMSKQGERRAKSPHKRHHKSTKSKCCVSQGETKQSFKEHANALTGDLAAKAYIPKIK